MSTDSHVNLSAQMCNTHGNRRRGQLPAVFRRPETVIRGGQRCS